MDNSVSGRRPLPRVALLGNFNEPDLAKYENLFPTIWLGKNVNELENFVHCDELDLLVISSGVDEIPDWIDIVHVICFSSGIPELPGPNSPDNIFLANTLETEEFNLPDLSLSWNRRRDADISNVSNVKGWTEIDIGFGSGTTGEQDKGSRKYFEESSIISNYHTGLPLAVAFNRNENNLGIAWLPNPVFNQVAWVELILIHWAKLDPDRFPGFGDWTKSVEWMTKEEEDLSHHISELERNMIDAINQYKDRIGELSNEFSLLAISVNTGRRRLLTAQGNELVDEVIKVFLELGFDVKNVDDILSPESPKREDLRLTDPEFEDWEAIVEVRGYRRSAGKTSDLSRMARFANLFNKEKKKYPDNRIYVINGQIELLPSQRQEPLESATEDIDIFGEQDGIVISTIDLFKIAKRIEEFNIVDLKKSIRETKGRWKPI
jgi:hypothetical protein